jgi:glutathione-regulated potassium-efflux system ancillary protein KefG
MPRVLHILVHPSYEKSKANRILQAHVPNSPDITSHDLYELYPTFEIDVKQEQSLLAAHDVILIQHPLYWYSCPPLFKQWIDLVLECGWAYGEGGTALVGKKWIQVLTTGGNEKAYSHSGFHQHELRDFLLPFERTAGLCQMNYLPPFVMYGVFQRNEAQMQEEGLRFSEFVTNLLGETHG